MHPWEDWAETWAHYLHVTDTVETASACGIALRPRRAEEPSVKQFPAEPLSGATSFDRLIESWFPLTYVLNNLNRGLGLPDGYPFVLSEPAIEKMRFVHDTIEAAVTSRPTSTCQPGASPTSIRQRSAETLTKDANNVLVSLPEQQLLTATERREAAVEGINAHIAFVNEAGPLLALTTAQTTTALTTFQIP
jgi:hypothetical protein